jgi:hypothetical protein
MTDHDVLTVRTGNSLVLMYAVILLAVSVVAVIYAVWWQAIACAAIGGFLIAIWTPRVTVTVDGPIATVAWSSLWKTRARSFPVASLITVGAFQAIPGENRSSRTSVQILTSEGEIGIALVPTEGRAERIAADIGAFLAQRRSAREL